ncbi:hypothetical protein ACFOTA_10370 [Chitinophaga sp. GCM10012297]|uniref:DUF4369 domain-containing protein n=1 Tax=Chitinophaga chungangae TaxID=2821488 RepID=A0ABS3YD75_9BACT|nr:hypothetical protein [Chitinophaga chungangae]MBO9152611.1 hypothetical protein [Chitinophaga chungangae]
MKLSRKKYLELTGFIVALLVFIWAGVREFNTETEVSRHGVYVIGKVTMAESGKGGRKIEAWYRYKKRLHVLGKTERFNFYVRPGTRIIIQLLPDDPEKFVVVTAMGVPHCLDNDKSMDTVWQEFPACYAAPPEEARDGLFFDSSLIKAL